MSIIEYNKLVRDKIPQIIENDGKSCNIRILDDDEYMEMIDAKLSEELTEYNNDKSIEELADLLEVIYAAAKARGYSRKDLDVIRNKKLKERGGFENKVFLETVIG
ncbi:nucleoside triphosphate pyrophosphohydrolase [Butyrivibrio sp. NC2002]|uniref:nucleoside triphosphate pyrophosphohydrolase n=1 Tax=Butyrivibrio sp. NC2002 TaxID=1410610 RepID=UPI000560C3EB|nr:nucleoside triphosphate pyrophosphohydrolase [Butyrivibrio sp. NC2002]